MDFSFLNEIIISILLGITQGITEFLPISSTAHLRLISDLVINRDIGTITSNIIQIGTLIAILQYFNEDLKKIFLHLKKISTSKKEFGEFLFNVNSWLRNEDEKKYQDTVEDTSTDILIAQIALGSLPIMVVGFLAHDYIDIIRQNILNIAYFLIFGSILLTLGEFFHKKNKGSEKTYRMSKWEVITIGLFQCFAVLPGVSRSGATLSGALLIGRDRKQSIRFSFLLSIPALMVSGGYDLIKLFLENEDSLTLLPNSSNWKEDSILLSIIGLVVALCLSYLAGLVSLKWLLKYLSTNSNKVFIIYRIALALAIIVFASGLI
jgi:undecaprenyl-diphosphatase